MTEENHEPGPSTTQSASSTASTASGTAGGSCGTRCDLLHLAPGERDGGLAAHRGQLVGPLRVVAPYERLELQRHGRHRQHPAVRPEQLAHQVERLDVVAELLPEGDDQQIAHRVPVQLALG